MRPLRELPTIEVTIAPVLAAHAARRAALVQRAQRALRKLAASRWPETKTPRLQWLWRRMENGDIEQFTLCDVLWVARWLGLDPVSMLDDEHPGRLGSLTWTPAAWVRQVDAGVRARVQAMRKFAEKTPTITLATKLRTLFVTFARLDCGIADVAPVVAAPRDQERRYRQRPGKMYRTKAKRRLDEERHERSRAAKGARLHSTLAD